MNVEAAKTATGVTVLAATWCAFAYVWPLYVSLGTAGMVFWIWVYVRAEEYEDD